MKKVFSSHSECAHVWAQQSQDSGKSANMFFEGTRIFSYGYHYCIANFIKPNLVLINSKGYSNSTAKHHNHVLRSLRNDIKSFSVPSVGWSKYDFQNEIDHKENLAYFEGLIKSNLEKAKTATKSTNWLINNAGFLHSDLVDYCNAFNLPLPEKFNLSDDLITRAKKQEQKENEARLKRELFEAKQNEAILNYALPAWLNSENTFSFEDKIYSSDKVGNLPNCYLRVKGENVNTSKGANVPLKAAKVLFEMIKQGKDIKGWQIGNYTVISLNGVLTIGCHKIERSEINRFAGLMNWGQIEQH